MTFAEEVQRAGKYYFDRTTGEITVSHRQAVEWYRAGHPVEIWKNDRCVMSWEF